MDSSLETRPVHALHGAAAAYTTAPAPLTLGSPAQAADVVGFKAQGGHHLSLQELAATPGLGACIMGALPLPDRVRLRGLCRAFAAAVDASLQAEERISGKDLCRIDKRGKSSDDGNVLRWLAGKCPNLRVLGGANLVDADTEAADASQGVPRKPPDQWPKQHWWRLCVADSVLAHVAGHCRRLRVLSLHCCSGVGDGALREIAAHCGELRHLDIGGCRRVTDVGIIAVTAGCQMLEHLSVQGIDHVSDASMMAVAAHCPSLRHLDVRSTRVADDGIIAVAENCPLLEFLDVLCTGVGARGTAAIIHGCARLMGLDLWENTADAANELGADSCRQLASLRITSRRLMDGAAARIAARCTRLSSLSLSGCSALGDASIIAFATNSRHLAELSLYRCPAITDAGMLAVAARCGARLKAVGIAGCEGVSDDSMVELVERCPGLQKLDLGGSYVGNRTVLAAGRNCPDLRTLDISPWLIWGANANFGGGGGRPGGVRAWEEVHVKDDGLALVLRNCLKLESLNLGGCRGLTDAGIAIVSDSCKCLRELLLTNCVGCFTPQGLAAMAPHLSALETLEASNCDAVTDVSLVAIAERCPRLRRVDMSGCEVTDCAVAALARQCALVSLWATGCRGVTDVGLVVVGEFCRRLDTLSVEGCTRVTVVGALAVLAGCEWLTHLDMEGCSLGPKEKDRVVNACRPYMQVLILPLTET